MILVLFVVLVVMVLLIFFVLGLIGMVVGNVLGGFFNLIYVFSLIVVGLIMGSLW